MGTIKDRNGRDLVGAEEIKKRWKEQPYKITWNSHPKQILMIRISMKVWSVTQRQTFWRVKSSGL